jgi:DNA-directed RNA polymerase specialized sigma24 family protein
MTSARKAHETETPRTHHTEDTGRWTEVVRRFAPYVHAVVRAHRLPEPAADEVFDDVFVQTWANMGRLDGDDALRGWIVELTQRLATERREALGPMLAAPPQAQLDELRGALQVSEALWTRGSKRVRGRCHPERRRASPYLQET